MDRGPGLKYLAPITLDQAAARPDRAADWIVKATLAVREASLRAIETARAHSEADAREAATKRTEAELAAEAQARAKAQARAVAENEARVRAEERAREEAEQERAAAVLRGAQKEAAMSRIRAALASNYLAVDGMLAADPSRELISRDELDLLKTQFVQQWAAGELPDPLDAEQASAVAATGGDLKVVARAGSGKTRTLIARAAFLQKHCGVLPDELLLLAFNRKAAHEIKDRLGGVLGDDLPHAMTFHALAHAIVHPDEQLLVDDRSIGQLGLSREIQDVIDEHIRSPAWHDRIRDLMLAHFREEWERIVEGAVDLPIEEFLVHRRAVPRETLRGEYVKSFGEREIANALFEHDVRYLYERNHRWNGVNYRPDFTIFHADGGVIIEYFGLEGDPDYDEMSEDKRKYWARRDGWTLLEYSPQDLASAGPAGFRGLLTADLAARGVPTRLRDEEEIWQDIRRRAVDRFSQAMSTFVGRCRKLEVAPERLDSMIAAHVPATRSEELFLEVAHSVYSGYLARLGQLGQDDFDGLMWRAATLAREGTTRFVRDHGRESGDLEHLRYVLVDEFQDFSYMFYEMLGAIRQANPNVQFFCVGDDWQAINGFAGAELRFFTEFPRYFRNTADRTITTNYRSTASIVRAGNALMKGEGAAAKARVGASNGRVWVCPLDRFAPTAFEREQHEGDEITPAVLRLVRRFLDEGLRVVMLSRRNHVNGYVRYRHPATQTGEGLDRFLMHIRSFVPEDDRARVTISTAHGYKGLEQSAVIVLDAMQGSYPLIHPSWLFLRIFGDSLETIEKDERRLFYVAITRAQHSLALITDNSRRSPFLGEIAFNEQLDILNWSELPEVGSLDGAHVEVRAYGAFSVRDQLKGLGYRYQPDGKYWFKTVLEEGFSWGALREQAWTIGCGRIEVLASAGTVINTTAIDQIG
jgi:DNA helicase-4